MNPIIELVSLIEFAEWIISAAQLKYSSGRDGKTAPTDEEFRDAISEWLTKYNTLYNLKKD